jgi:hypothetical protein
VEEARLNQNKDKTKALAHTEVANFSKIKESPFLSALAERFILYIKRIFFIEKREELVLNGRLLTIIFLR